MADQVIIYVLDASFASQPIACTPVTWNGVSGVFMQMVKTLPWNVSFVTAAGIAVIKNSPGTLGGVFNMDPDQPQAGNISIFNNASTNSGQIMVNANNLVTKVDYPPGGAEMSIGITASVTGTPTSGGYMVLWV